MVYWFFLWQEIGYPLKKARTKVQTERNRRESFNNWLSRTNPNSCSLNRNTRRVYPICYLEWGHPDGSEEDEWMLNSIPEHELACDFAI
tara:strand:- start:277 stop:543 length:267 start_codon:yes stop_codon:yes gene_type:complete